MVQRVQMMMDVLSYCLRFQIILPRLLDELNISSKAALAWAFRARSPRTFPLTTGIRVLGKCEGITKTFLTGSGAPLTNGLLAIALAISLKHCVSPSLDLTDTLTLMRCSRQLRHDLEFIISVVT